MSKIKTVAPATPETATDKVPVVDIATATANATAKTEPIVEPTSEKLTELREQRKVKWTDAKTLPDDSTEQMTAFGEVIKLDGLIKAEIASIKKIENDAKLAEQRNARVKLIDTMLTAYEEARLASSNDALSIDEKNTFNDAYKKAREVIETELLARYATSSPAKTSPTTNGTTKPAGERGATGKAIIDLFLANRASGMSDTENKKAIVNAGHSRGTTGAVVLQWQRENGEAE